MADPDDTTTSRPRRSTRAPMRIPEVMTLSTPSTPSRQKRRAQNEQDPTVQLDVLLKNPKSELTAMNISDVLNAGAWDMLSVESRAFLCTLLPPTAFRDYQPSIEVSHPSRAPDAMDVDDRATTCAFSPDLLDRSIFTDPHFLAAAHTFQDHLYSGWLEDAHMERVRLFQQGVRDGTVSAPWKDEVWESENTDTVSSEKSRRTMPANVSGSQPESGARAGEAAEVKLTHLTKNDVVKVGDIFAYKRHFSTLGLIVEKDVIIDSIHPKTYALTVLIVSGTAPHLPQSLLLPTPSSPTATTQSMVVTSPSMLENGILDIDGRVDRARRPNGNAWKSLTVWRWRDDGAAGVDARGGRENFGTLFYLRWCYYHDR